MISEDLEFLKLVEKGDFKKVKETFEKNYNIHENYFLCMQALESAAEPGDQFDINVKMHEDIVKYLLSKGCDPTWDNNILFGYAAKQGNLKMVKWLLKNYPEINPVDRNFYGIGLAWENGHT